MTTVIGAEMTPVTFDGQTCWEEVGQLDDPRTPFFPRPIYCKQPAFFLFKGINGRYDWVCKAHKPYFDRIPITFCVAEREPRQPDLPGIDDK